MWGVCLAPAAAGAIRGGGGGTASGEQTTASAQTSTATATTTATAASVSEPVWREGQSMPVQRIGQCAASYSRIV